MDERALRAPGDDFVGGPAGEAADPALDPSTDLVCQQVVELVTDYLEGALPDDLRCAVERHLETCPACAVYIDQVRTTAASLREVPVESIDPGTRAALVAAFRGLIPGSDDGPAR